MKAHSMWVTTDGQFGNTDCPSVYSPAKKRKKSLGFGWQLLAVAGITLTLSSLFFYILSQVQLGEYLK